MGNGVSNPAGAARRARSVVRVWSSGYMNNARTTRIQRMRTVRAPYEQRANTVRTPCENRTSTVRTPYEQRGVCRTLASSQELLPETHEAERSRKKTRARPAHGVGGLCECMRCSSSWKAAWAECTCVGAARYMYVRGALRDIYKRTVF